MPQVTATWYPVFSPRPVQLFGGDGVGVCRRAGALAEPVGECLFGAGRR